MHVTVKAKGISVVGIPAEGLQVSVATGASAEDVLVVAGLAHDVGYLLALGEDALSPEEAKTHPLVEGDVLTVLPPLRGG